MQEKHSQAGNRVGSTFASVLGDLQFWVPLAVLAGGLILLAWVS